MAEMHKNRMAEDLRKGKTTLGLANMYGAPGIIEGMCKGWDFVWIDAQHGQFSFEQVVHALRAAEASGLMTLLRVAGHEAGALGQYADAAPSALMIPMVDNVDQAEAVVRAVRFPPRGNRSYGGRRVIDLYDRDFPTSTELLVVAQIESAEGIDNAEAISQVDGIDMLFFGPDDMRMALGLPLSTPVTEDRELRGAMEKVGRVARAAGKFAGCVATDPTVLRIATEMGYQLMIGGGDAVFLRTSAAQRLGELRQADGPAAQTTRSRPH